MEAIGAAANGAVYNVDAGAEYNRPGSGLATTQVNAMASTTFKRFFVYIIIII